MLFILHQLLAQQVIFHQLAQQDQSTLLLRVHEELKRNMHQLSMECLPVPFAFLLWVRLMERDEKFTLAFSPIFCALSITLLIAMLEFPDMQQYLFATGIIAGLFVLAPFTTCMHHIIRQPRPALVAVVAAMAGFNYYWLMQSIWMKMCDWTVRTVYFILHSVGMNNVVVHNLNDYVRVHSFNNQVILINSPSFTIAIMPACNGLEGIFLVNFLLSVMFLFDWQVFKRMHILLIYLLGIIYMLFMNPLRLAVYFWFGSWANRPDAWHWVQSLRGAPVYLFHSYVGFVFYLIAFGLFATGLYWLALRRKQLTIIG